VISGCSVYDNAEYGIYVYGEASPQISDCTVRNSKTGIYVYGYGTYIPRPVINGCSVYDNAEYGIYVLDTASPQIADCTVRNNRWGIYNSNPQFAVSGCSIYDNTQYNYYVNISPNTTVLDARNNWWGTTDPQQIKAKIFDYAVHSSYAVLDWSSFLNAENGSPVTAAPTGETYLIPGIYGNITLSGSYIVTSCLRVRAGQELTIAPGTTLKFMSGAYLEVGADATLTAGSSSGDPVLFTSLSSSPAAGAWEGIRFYDQSSGTLENCVIEYASKGIDVEKNTSPQISGCTIRNSRLGIFAYGYGTDIPLFAVNNCSVYDNTQYNYYVNIYSNTTVLDATNNWWGTDDTTAIAKTIWDYHDNSSLAIVNYDGSKTVFAGFYADKTTGHASLTVHFTSQSTGNTTSWQWDFDGDGNIDSTEQNPSFTYNQGGNYSVKLIVSDGTSTSQEFKLNYIQVLAPMPDLKVSDIQSSQAVAGQTFEVIWTVANAGTNPTYAPVWYDQVWISQDLNLLTRFSLGQFENPGYLAPGESYTQTKQFTVPANLKGIYYLFVITDNTNLMAETDNSNNFAYKQIEITPPPASDLSIILPITAPANAFSGQSVQVSYTVKNTGANVTNAGSWWDEMYLSKDTTLNTETATRLGT